MFFKSNEVGCCRYVVKLMTTAGSWVISFIIFFGHESSRTNAFQPMSGPEEFTALIKPAARPGVNISDSFGKIDM
jgi:hypothetical protein